MRHHQQPAASAGVRPMRSISAPTTSTSAYMPSTCAPIDREHVALRVVVVLDDHVAGQVHHRDHHAEAGQRGEHRRAHARPAQDLAQRRRRPRRRAARSRAISSAICCGSGRTSSTSASASTAMPAGRQPRHGQRVGVELAPGEQRAEHGRAEDRAEHRAEQHVGDAAGAPLGRVHVARRGADQQRDPARRAGQHEAERSAAAPSRGWWPARSASSRPRGSEAAGDHRPAPDAVHRAARPAPRPAPRRQEDRRPEPEQPAVAGHEHERDRRHRRDELQHRRVDGRDAGQQQRVSADRVLERRHR